MTDKMNPSAPKPPNDDVSLDHTWVPDGPVGDADVGTTFIGTASPDSDADQTNSNKSNDGIDVNATFVPHKAPDGDEDPESSSVFGVTLVGTPPNSDDSDETELDQKVSGSGKPVLKAESGSATGEDRIPETDGTVIFGDSNGLQERDDKDPQRTDPFLSGSPEASAEKSSGSRISGSGSGSSVSSQIWTKTPGSSLAELISIRTRSISGTGQFTPSENADFEIIEKLAEGGMGVVYVALQKSLNRQLAIKTLKHGSGSAPGTIGRSVSVRALSAADRQRREMFLSEALVTANLVHPNIIPIHELAETGEGIPYYVMKQVHGIPWNKRIREMSLEQNLDVMHKVCDAVAYAHHHGVINRDLKPENIMLGEFGEVLVLDWGLAVPAPHAAEQNFRSPVASFGAGTPAYMSPELWTGPPEAIGECSDIYLLGGILFEAVTGAAPHDFPKISPKGGRSELWQSIDDVLRGNRIRETSISGELIDIALKAMRTEPSERFGSVLELQFAIRNYQRHEESRRLSSRATELVQAQSADSHDYHTYQTAAALFEESLRTWPQNGVARTGLRTTRLQYARRAAAKGDYDLGLQVAALETDEDFVAISKNITTARRVRSGIKWAALTAMVCVVALGAKSIYDNGIITDLNAEVSVRKAEANAAITAADSAKRAAVVATDEAKIARANALTAQQEAEQSKLVATESAARAEMAKQEALVALASADASKSAAEVSKLDAAKAIATAEAANKKVLEANQLLVIAEDSVDRAREQQREAETASRVAQVEIQSQSIRGLTLNQNYSDALREIDRLLVGELLPQLPEAIRNQRSVELKAQREQLMKRARQSPEPIQTQAISPDRGRIAFGDAAGLVNVMQCPGQSLTWDPTDKPQQQQFNREITALQFVDPQKLVIASGSELYLWNLQDEQTAIMPGHSHPIQSLDMNGNLLLTADESGKIVVRNLDSGQTIATLNLKTQLRDVAFIPGSNDFICAGSRGGESADILAYRLTDSTLGNRPERLGQLRMSRKHNEPPRRISISPDGRLLVMSNSTNGDLVVLHAAMPAEGTENRFPFEHPSDLESVGNMTWLVTEHERPVNDIAWSQDGMKCLTASDDRTIGVWLRTNDAQSTLSREAVLRGHGARVTQAHFLDEAANQVASSSADRLNRLWDLETLEDDQRQIRNAFDLAGAAAALRRERAALRIARQRLLTSWSDEVGSATNPRLPATSIGTEPPGSVVIDQEPAEETVLNASSRLHRGSVRAVRFDGDGQNLVTGAADGSIVIWDAKTAQPVARPVTTRQASDEQFHEGHRFNLARMNIIGPSGTVLATAGYDGSLRLWNMDPASHRVGVQQQVISGLGLVNTFAASSNGEFLVMSAIQETDNPQPGQCSLWNINELLTSENVSPTALLSGAHKSEVTAITVSLDNRQIATGGRDGVIAIWDADTARLITSARAHAKNTIVTSLQWLTDGTLVSAGLDGQLAHWQIETDSKDSESRRRLTKTHTFRREKTPIEHMRVSPDGLQILSISVETDRAAKATRHHLDIWSIVAPESRRRVQLASVAGKKPVAITSAEWSPDGHRLLVCVDGIVQFLDCQSWKITRVFSAGPQTCTDARLAEQPSRVTGNELLVTSDGTTARLWDPGSGEQLASFRGPFPVRAVAFLSVDRRSFVVSGGASLRVFDGREGLLTFGRPLFRTREGGASQITSVDVCPADPSLFAAASANGIVTLWRWSSAGLYAEEVRVLVPAGHAVSCCRWSGDGSLLLAVRLDGVLTICTADGSSRQEIRPETLQSINLFAGDFTTDGQHIVAAGQIAGTSESKGWVIKVPAIASSREVADDPDSNELKPDSSSLIECTFSGHEAGGISSVGFIPDSPYLVSGGNDGAMVLWNWKQPLPGASPMAYEAFRFMTAGETTAHTAPITAIAVARSGRIASSGDDGKVSLWKLPIDQD